MDRFLIFFQRYIFGKKYILMDLEQMTMDTLDAIRPSQLRKFEDFEQANSACLKIEAFESAHCRVDTEFVGQPLFNSSKDSRVYDDMIDELLYEDNADEEEDESKNGKKEE